MLVNFWASPALRHDYHISFSYRTSEPYERGLKQRAQMDFPVFPLRLPDLFDAARWPASWPSLLRRALTLFIGVVVTTPVLCYEVWQLRRLFVRIKPTVVHINNGGYPAALSARAAAIAARLAGVSHVVMVVNNLAVGYAPPSRWFSFPLDQLVAHCVSIFVTGSHAAAERLTHVLRLPAGKCRAIHNGIAPRPHTETVHATRVRLGLEGFHGVVLGVVAVLRPNKGHIVLLEALSKIVRDEPAAGNVVLLIEGEGPLLNELQAFVKQRGLSEYCRFIGTEANIMNVMAVLDVLVLPSIDHEDFPNVILEAMSLGKPVIASRLAGTSEQVVHGESGLLVSPRDAGQLAEEIRRLVLDEALRRQMGQVGQQRFRSRFTAEAAVGSYLRLYRSLIGRTAPSLAFEEELS